MAFADPERVKGILAGAGFQDIVIEPLDMRTGGDTLDDSVDMALRIGQLGGALRQIDASDALKREVEAALRQAFQPHLEDGLVKLQATAWIVSAT